MNELTALANSKGWSIEAVFAEKISGAKANNQRAELLNMVTYVEANTIDKVLVTELSSLSRDTLQVLEVIEMLNSKGISLYIQNYNIETLTDKGKVNPMSQFLITILAEVARMERKTIRERVASGYANFRSNGGKVGRKKGYRKSDEAMMGKNQKNKPQSVVARKIKNLMLSLEVCKRILENNDNEEIKMIREYLYLLETLQIECENNVENQILD